jgi:hypothetical protein
MAGLRHFTKQFESFVELQEDFVGYGKAEAPIKDVIPDSVDIIACGA